eukprot:NODE_542_length_2100_cov_63.668018_g502_i0.p1 GENE.NODE_542_length_2100_cov_63.668018_g502_i0~~NODE_542_length_2100_cov_63.668018_g502_i0.p1  ORF type:complete len:669 (-),score=221.62 NODE_542_length_2100_cov_63.668018_g502_i0:93-2042(-)
MPVPLAYIVSLGELKGRVEADAVAVAFAFEIHVLKDRHFVECKLLPSSIALESLSLAHHQHTPPTGVPKVQLRDTKGDVVAHFVTKNAHLYLVALKGHYAVTLQAFVPFASSLGQAVFIPTPIATRTLLTFSIPRSDIAVAVTPALKVEQSTDGPHTCVRCVLNPTEQVVVKWTHTNQASSSTQEKDLTVTAGLDILHAIGGGIVATDVWCNFTISNGAVSVFEVQINPHHGTTMQDSKLLDSPRCRVLNVQCNGLHKWEVLEPPGMRLIRIALDTVVEGFFQLQITTELEMVNTSCQVVVPTFTLRNVDRVRGSLAIQGRTAVEINELASKFVSKMDVKELPRTLQVPNVLHCYKFLSPQHLLQLQVTKHRDVGVLVAMVEHAVYDVTHTGTHLLYALLYQVKNTQSQFARLELPHKDTVIWSTMVGGKAVKPAINREGQIMLPLLKSTDALFPVEVVCVLPVDHMQPRPVTIRTLDIPLPTIDLPINHLYVTTYLPQDYQYGEWVGTLKEVSTCAAPRVGPHLAQKRAKRKCKNLTALPKRHALDNCWEEEDFADSVNYSPRSSVSMSDSDSNSDEFIGKEEGPCGMVAGIKPLRLKMGALRVGTQFHFERLLLDCQEHLHVSTEYQPRPQKPLRKPLETACQCTLM